MTWPVAANFRKIRTPWNLKGRLWSCGRHTGVDIMLPVGTPLTWTGIAPGVVRHVGWGGWGKPYGMHVVVEDSKGFRHLYAHGRDGGAKVRVGQRVNPGQVLLLSGNTGNSTGPHLHYEVRKAPYVYAKSDVDPGPFLRMSPPVGPLLPWPGSAVVANALRDRRPHEFIGIMRQNLIDRGYSSAAAKRTDPKVWDASIKAAVVAFQKRNFPGSVADGEPGPKTWDLLVRKHVPKG